MSNQYNTYRPQGGSYQNGGTFQNQYNGHGNNQGGQPPKRSGCKTGKMESGKRWVSGWKGVGRDHVSFISNPGKDNGKTSNPRWTSMIANFHDANGKTWTENCLWDNEKNRLKFPKAGMVANPNAPRGGYFGKGGTKMKINNNR